MTSKKDKEKTRPISVRLTEAEIACLQMESGPGELSKHIRQRLVGGELRKRRRVRMPRGNETELAAILARLGKLGIGESLRELAYSARIGALPLDEETAQALQSASRSLYLLRQDVIRALGLREGADDDPEG